MREGGGGRGEGEGEEGRRSRRGKIKQNLHQGVRNKYYNSVPK
jgi:hypothetical protein